ncbi:MAPEG family protein [Dyella sp. A6]|uniref:MAPEG family protein n=1 Tax=Dyella aluminiiresistens TaxID=3069105 RepID=UPI002E759F02|nr:MAPEG family protein [Dyella sp. A6]
MSIELHMLAWSVLLGLVQVMLPTLLATGRYGLGWAAGPRDADMPAAPTVAARLDRARANFLETFPFFAAAVLAVIALQHHDETTALGAQAYFWARLVYVPVYAAGIPFLRTLVWLVSIVGIVMLLLPLL